MANSFPWKFERSKEFLEFLRGKSKWALIVFMIIQLIAPFKHHDATTMAFALYTLLAPVIYLMYFIKYYMKEKYDNPEENAEISRVVYLKMALDCFQMVWICFSYNGVLCIISDP